MPIEYENIDLRPLRTYLVTETEAQILMLRTYDDMLKFFDGRRADLEVRHHIRKHINLMWTSTQYARFCTLKAIRYNKSVRR